MSDRQFRGEVRFRNERGAYGFIQREGPGVDVFVHVRNVSEGELVEDVNVEFNIESSERGPRAKDVRVIEQNPSQN